MKALLLPALLLPLLCLPACGESGAPAPAPPATPDKPVTGHIKPQREEILWTAYYIAPVKKAAGDAGRTVEFKDLAGGKIRYTMTAGSFRRAETEAVAMAVDAHGRKRFGYRVA
jgi:hypothetical protein